MHCFQQKQRHTAEEDPVMTAKQATAEASEGHSYSLLPAPSAQCAHASSTATGKRFGAIKQHLHFTCKCKKWLFFPQAPCVAFLSPRRPPEALKYFSLCPRASDLPHPLPSLNPPEVNPAFTLNPYIGGAPKNNAVAKWYSCYLQIRLSLFYKALVIHYVS